MVQVPELDVAVASSDEVGAVIREGDGSHLTGHLIGCYHHVFLVHRQITLSISENVLNVTRAHHMGGKCPDNP